MDPTTVIYILIFGAMLGGLLGYTIGHMMGSYSTNQFYKRLREEGKLIYRIEGEVV